MKFERCEHWDNTSIVDGDHKGVKCSLSFVLKDQVKKVAFLGGGIELCGSSSFPGGLTNLLNTEGILTLPMFLLSDGSLI